MTKPISSKPTPSKLAMVPFVSVDDMMNIPHRMAVQEDEHPPSLPVMDGEAVELVKAFQNIDDKYLRRSLLETIQAAASRKQAESAV